MAPSGPPRTSRRGRTIAWTLIPGLVGGLVGPIAGPVIGTALTDDPDIPEASFVGFIRGGRLGPPIGAILGAAVGAWFAAATHRPQDGG